jgi:hypothetical protein
MAAVFAPHAIKTCSAAGRAIAEPYIAEQRRRREEAELATLGHLRAGRLKEAAVAVAEYERSRLFARGIGMDWNRYPSMEVDELQTIFSEIPGIVSGLNPEAAQPLRIAAAMMLLWGERAPAPTWGALETPTGLQMSPDVVARMFVFYAWHKQQLRPSPYVTWRSATIHIAGDDRTCDACRAISGREYPIERLPELPLPTCTSVMGCRCSPLLRV